MSGITDVTEEGDYVMAGKDFLIQSSHSEKCFKHTILAWGDCFTVFRDTIKYKRRPRNKVTYLLVLTDDAWGGSRIWERGLNLRGL